MQMGAVPPHWELYASINPIRFQMFMQEISYLSFHKSIDPIFFTFLRYYIAVKNGFEYCKRFNYEYLLSKGHTDEELNKLIDSKESLPLDHRYQKLFCAAIEAMNNPKGFTSQTIDELKAIEWSDADIMDAVDHASFLFKFSKILSAYLK